MAKASQKDKDSLWQRLKSRRRRLQFTREGRAFVAISIGIGLAAINTGNNLLYLLLGWLLAIIIASGILSNRVLKGLRFTRTPPTEIFANRPFLMELRSYNDKKRNPSYSIEVEDIGDSGPLDKKCYFLKIPANASQHTSYRHTFATRGRKRLRGFRVSTRFPFALFRKARYLEHDTEVIVYPAVHPVALPAPRSPQLGTVSSLRVGRRGEFHGMREYRVGDDRRDIHWRTTARTGQLMVKEYEEEASKRAAIFCDNALPLQADGEPSDRDIDALESAISLAASLTNSYLAAGYRVELHARGLSIPADSGPKHLRRVLRKLALLESTSPDESFRPGYDRGAEAVLIVPKDVAAQHGRPQHIARVVEAA